MLTIKWCVQIFVASCLLLFSILSLSQGRVSKHLSLEVLLETKVSITSMSSLKIDCGDVHLELFRGAIYVDVTNIQVQDSTSGCLTQHQRRLPRSMLQCDNTSCKPALLSYLFCFSYWYWRRCKRKYYLL